jgi:hypothetical protein
MYNLLKKGFMGLTTKMDVHNRKILSWVISNIKPSYWLIDVFEDAIKIIVFHRLLIAIKVLNLKVQCG